jgi:hypothetical protein
MGGADTTKIRHAALYLRKTEYHGIASASTRLSRDTACPAVLLLDSGNRIIIEHNCSSLV